MWTCRGVCGVLVPVDYKVALRGEGVLTIQCKVVFTLHIIKTETADDIVLMVQCNWQTFLVIVTLFIAENGKCMHCLWLP